jgi:hypothetical protein
VGVHHLAGTPHLAADVSGLKIIGHGNTDNNLESHCTWSYILKIKVHGLCLYCSPTVSP